MTSVNPAVNAFQTGRKTLNGVSAAEYSAFYYQPAHFQCIDQSMQSAPSLADDYPANFSSPDSSFPQSRYIVAPHNSFANSPSDSPTRSSPRQPSQKDISTLCHDLDKLGINYAASGLPSAFGSAAFSAASHTPVASSASIELPRTLSLRNANGLDIFTSTNSIWKSSKTGSANSHDKPRNYHTADYSNNAAPRKALSPLNAFHNSPDLPRVQQSQFAQHGYCHSKYSGCNNLPPPLQLPAPSIQIERGDPQKSLTNSKQLARLSRKIELDQEALRKYSKYSLGDLKNKLYAMSKDQYGCRYLQKLLDDQPEESCSAICAEIINNFPELMTDPFGNYLSQKFIQTCNSSQLTLFVKSIAMDLPRIVKDMHGTRAVQKLLERVDSDIQAHYISKSLERDVANLVKDLNANHVLQKCLKYFSAEFNQFIYNMAIRRCRELSIHRHGCCVIQRCIDHANVVQCESLVREIARNACQLVEDPFGNYVVQYVLDLKDPAYTNLIVSFLMEKICSYSLQKYSSNVVEKCLRVATGSVRTHLYKELFRAEALDVLLRDSFGNYVIQTALDAADPNQRRPLMEACLTFLDRIISTAPGKRLINKMIQLDPVFLSSIGIHGRLESPLVAY